MTDEPEDNDEQPGESEADDGNRSGSGADEYDRSRGEAAGRAALQAEFEGGREDEEFDPELVALAEERSRPSALRPILFIAVIALSVWIVSDFQTEIEYFFSSAEPVELGDLTDMAQGPDADPNWSETFPSNRYVSLSGISKRASQSQQHRFFKLTGVPVYVKDPVDEDELPPKLQGPSQSGPDDRRYFEGKGRMLSFGDLDERYTYVKRYYRDTYGTRFCEDLDAKDKQRIRSEQRSAIIDNWRERWDNASDKEREQRGLTPEPTEREIKEILGANEICSEAFLIQATVAPRDHWMYVLTATLFGLFMLVNVYWLIRWVRDFFRSDVDLSHLEDD